jgi:hypothetical protein
MEAVCYSETLASTYKSNGDTTQRTNIDKNIIIYGKETERSK